jgi:hypothetical protein
MPLIKKERRKDNIFFSGFSADYSFLKKKEFCEEG